MRRGTRRRTGSYAPWVAAALLFAAAGTVAANDVNKILAQYDARKDVVSVTVGGNKGSLKNGQTTYTLVALEKTGSKKVSPLGMPEPIKANFYYGGFIRINVGKVSTGAVGPTLAADKDHAGAPCVKAVWALEGDAIEARFSLVPDSSALMVAVSSKAGANAKQPIYVRLQMYPQSFNRRKRGKPRDNFMLTSTGKRLAKGAAETFAGTERWVYAGDAKYAGKAGGAAVGVAPDTLKEMKVYVGTYPARVDLYFKPAASARFFLVDYGMRELADAPKEVPRLLEHESARFDSWVKGK